MHISFQVLCLEILHFVLPYDLYFFFVINLCYLHELLIYILHFHLEDRSDCGSNLLTDGKLTWITQN